MNSTVFLFDFAIIGLQNIIFMATRCQGLSSGGLGGRTGIYLANGKIRKLSPRECSRLMGFPSRFKIAQTDNTAYKQFGNIVVVDVIQQIVIKIIIVMEGEHL